MKSGTENNIHGPAISVYNLLLKKHQTEVASVAGSVFSTVITFPMDTIKCQLQAYPTSYNGAFDCIRKVYAQSGATGFFKGLAAPLMNVSAVRTVSLSVFQHSKNVLHRNHRMKYGVDLVKDEKLGRPVPLYYTTMYSAIAGAAAGGVATFISCPIELIKLSKQLAAKMKADAKNYECPEKKAMASSYHGMGTVSTFKHIYEKRGIRGLFIGGRMHLVRDMIGTAAFFSSYEVSKQLMATTFNTKKGNTASVLVASIASGIASWIVIYPLDQAKTEYQRQALELPVRKYPPSPVVHWFRSKGYRGITVSMTRSCASNVLFWFVVENVKSGIDRLPPREIDL